MKQQHCEIQKSLINRFSSLSLPTRQTARVCANHVVNDCKAENLRVQQPRAAGESDPKPTHEQRIEKCFTNPDQCQ